MADETRGTPKPGWWFEIDPVQQLKPWLRALIADQLSAEIDVALKYPSDSPAGPAVERLVTEGGEEVVPFEVEHFEVRALTVWDVSRESIACREIVARNRHTGISYWWRADGEYSAQGPSLDRR